MLFILFTNLCVIFWVMGAARTGPQLSGYQKICASISIHWILVGALAFGCASMAPVALLLSNLPVHPEFFHIFLSFSPMLGLIVGWRLAGGKGFLSPFLMVMSLLISLGYLNHEREPFRLDGTGQSVNFAPEMTMVLLSILLSAAWLAALYGSQKKPAPEGPATLT